jgi:L-fucose mutarotase
MLTGIDPLLNGDRLLAPRRMGHGEARAADANVPAATAARGTPVVRPLRREACTAARAVRAILSPMPPDACVDDVALRTEAAGTPALLPPEPAEVEAGTDRAEGRPPAMTGVGRCALHDLARGARAAVQTGERRFRGDVILRKGAIAPGGA